MQVVGQLIRTQRVDLPIEMFAHGADGARVGVHRLGLKALELEVLRWLAYRFSNAGVAWFNGIMGVFLRWDVLHNKAARIDDMTMRITSWDTGVQWRRVAASSNPSFKRTRFGSAGLAFISFWARAGQPPRAAHVKR